MEGDRVMKMPLDIGGQKGCYHCMQDGVEVEAHAEILQSKQIKSRKKDKFPYGLGTVIRWKVVIWGNVVVDPHLPKRQLEDQSHVSPRTYNQVKEKPSPGGKYSYSMTVTVVFRFKDSSQSL